MEREIRDECLEIGVKENRCFTLRQEARRGVLSTDWGGIYTDEDADKTGKD